ncbi:MAG TPA: hypothetical protein VM537_02745 [Anaerolineae bacterium]|nr:hypothetical protein [Anaerolineae bacterium]
MSLLKDGGYGVSVLFVLATIRLYIDLREKEKAARTKDKEVSDLLEARNQQLIDLTRECVEKFNSLQLILERQRENRDLLTAAGQELRDLNTKLSNRGL